jgi:adenylate kinase family enzyme
MSQRLEAGKSINESFSRHSYVDDDIIIKLMETIVKEFEEKKCNYIIEGFPRT